MRRCLSSLASRDGRNLSASYGVRASSSRLQMLRQRARLLLAHGVEGMWAASDHSSGYYGEGALHNREGIPPPCCSITLDGPTSNGLADEWRCHGIAAPVLTDAQWADDGSLPYVAAGLHVAFGSAGTQLPPKASSGVVSSPLLAGALLSVAAERTVPTNRSLTPRYLAHALGREGDWIFPGRVSFGADCKHSPCASARQPKGVHSKSLASARIRQLLELSSEGVSVRAVAAGSGLWAAVMSSGEALVCVAPCTQLQMLPSPSPSPLVNVAVGNLSLFLITAAGELFSAASDERGVGVRGAGVNGGTIRSRAGTVQKAPLVPRLGELVRVGGPLERRRVAHVAAGPHTAVAVTADGSVFAWGLLAPFDGRSRPRTTAEPVEWPLPARARACGVALGAQHCLLLTTDGAVYTAALPTADDLTRRATSAPDSATLAALGRTARAARLAFELHEAVLAPERTSRERRRPRATAAAVAAGRGFSLALTATGATGVRGELLYWGGRGAPLRKRRTAARRILRPAAVGSWCRQLRARSFLMVAAHESHIVALDASGALFSWLEGRWMPRKIEGVADSAVSALAVGEGLALLVSPTFDTLPVVSPLVQGAVPLGAAPPESKPGRGAVVASVLATPAPMARPVVVRGDNIGCEEVRRARPDAFHLARDGFVRGMRTPCWWPGSRATRCPFARKADCAEWNVNESTASVKDNGTVSLPLRCVPAAILLRAPGCSVPAVEDALRFHPDVTFAPTGTEPWWQHTSLSNFSAAMAAASATAAAKPAGQLIVQLAPLNVHTVGATVLRRSGVTLADLLPRVQPGLKALLLVCDPIARLGKVTPAASTARLEAQQRAFFACLQQSPALLCAAQLDGGRSELAGGAYALPLRELLRALPAEQVRVLRSEDASAEPRRTLHEVLAFLGLEDAGVGTPRPATLSPSVHSDARYQTAARSAVDSLHSFYEEFEDELVQLLDGDERFRYRPAAVES